jgi:CBS domain-containing protein
MNAADLMTRNVATIAPTATVQEAARLMLERHVSALPVVDQQGALVGMISEGDLLRRVETGTDRKPSWWLDIFASGEQRAEGYLKTHGTRVGDVMSRSLYTVEPSTPLAAVADLLERRRIKRVPVVEADRIVGIVSRADLLRAIALARPAVAPMERSDQELREAVTEAIQDAGLSTAMVNVMVSEKVVHLWGVVRTEAEHSALRVAAESVPGALALEDHVNVAPRLVYSAE